jgi:hypothetical protein
VLEGSDDVYGFLKVGSINVIGESVQGYQPVVMDYFNCCGMKYNINLMAEQRKKIHDKINCKDCTEDGIDEKWQRHSLQWTTILLLCLTPIQKMSNGHWICHS